jgi:hypothetical protein
MRPVRVCPFYINRRRFPDFKFGELAKGSVGTHEQPACNGKTAGRPSREVNGLGRRATLRTPIHIHAGYERLI